MLNPYEGINWDTVQQVMTTTHDHVYDTEVSTSTKQHFNNLYNGGVRCFAISNYYPSAPMYPLSDWQEELDEEIPTDIVEVPNAEHHHFSIKGSFGNSVHLNSVGSLFSSGHPHGVSPTGYNGAVEQFVKDALNELIYSDGGGITINHPTWTKNQSEFPDELFIYILDLDERVLGIEMLNSQTFDLTIWDKILYSGRRCWGFAVPDHRHKNNPDWIGRSMLLVPEFTDHECLKAIRNGSFYTKVRNTNFRFTKIEARNGMLTVEASEACTIRFIADGAIIKETQDTTAESCALSNADVYLRAEAETEYDRLFTQPIMLYLRPIGQKSNHKIELLYSI